MPVTRKNMRKMTIVFAQNNIFFGARIYKNIHYKRQKKQFFGQKSCFGWNQGGIQGNNK